LEIGGGWFFSYFRFFGALVAVVGLNGEGARGHDFIDYPSNPKNDIIR